MKSNEKDTNKKNEAKKLKKEFDVDINVEIDSDLDGKTTSKSEEKDNGLLVELEFSKAKEEMDDKDSIASKLGVTLNRKTDFKVYELILFAVLIMLVSVFLTVVVMNDVSCKQTNISNNKSKLDSSLAEFEEVYDLINDSYYKDINKKTLIEGAINGMLASLEDPHTSYFNKVETENFNELMNGSYEGIGAEVSLDADGNVIVFSVFKNSPAYEVGLKFNDKIMEVNGKNTKGMSTTEVVSLIKDENRKSADIKIERDGNILEFNVEKRIIIIESVESKVYDINDKKIGYVMINTFANNTYEQFRSNIEKLETENIKGLVIDVRGNSGGYLHSVTSMLDMFLPKGTVSYQIADKKTTYKYTASTSESRNYPIAVLVNKSSASASEILAVGLKESYGAEIIGTYTYGKGTVQTTKDLTTSGGMIKYTIQKWLSPKGNWINGVGVKPSIEIELSEDFEKNPVEENDNQLQKALNVIANK